MRPVYRGFHTELLSSRLATSKPRNVAPFANGDLYHKTLSILQRQYNYDETYRMRVGPRPRVNAEKPSVRHTVRTQSSVDLYFCPVEGEKPSVCIRDLIMSMGYITAHSYRTPARMSAYTSRITTAIKKNSQRSQPQRRRVPPSRGGPGHGGCPSAPSRAA